VRPWQSLQLCEGLLQQRLPPLLPQQLQASAGDPLLLLAHASPGVVLLVGL
jgi:hypothetical protein